MQSHKMQFVFISLLLTILLFNFQAFGHGGDENDMGAHMARMNNIKNMLKNKLGADYSKPLPVPKQNDISTGKTIFTTNCVSCHGEKGKGDGVLAKALPMPPANFTDPMHASFYSARGRLWIIRHGSPNTPMIGWLGTLSEKETYQVLSYIQTLKSQTSKEMKMMHNDHGNKVEHHHEH